MKLVLYHLSTCLLNTVSFNSPPNKTAMEQYKKLKLAELAEVILFSQDKVQYNELVQDLVHPAAG